MAIEIEIHPLNRDKGMQITRAKVVVKTGRGKKSLLINNGRYALATVISKIVFKYIGKGSTEIVIGSV